MKRPDTIAKMLSEETKYDISIHNGGGYWYIAAEKFDGDKLVVYETRSVMAVRFSDLTEESWRNEILALIQSIDGK